MTMNKVRKLTVELDEETYRALIDKALKEGYSIVSDYVVLLIKKDLQQPMGKPLDPDELFSKLKPKIERVVQDNTNRFMEIISDLRTKVAELYEKYEEIAESLRQARGEASGSYGKPVVKPTTRKTGIERLKEEKILFESSLPSRIQRDKFFSYLEREGAVVLNLSKERVAVDREYWDWFKNTVFNELTTDREDEIKERLGGKGYELFARLKEDSLVIYDNKRRRWIPLERVFK